MINPFSSVMIAPMTTRLKVSVDDYKECKSFLINTFGVTGTIRIPRLKHNKHTKNLVNPIDPCLDPDIKYIELGTYIGMCPHPYSSTKVLKFQPRYIIVNRLDLPIVIKENKSAFQVGVRQGEEVPFTLSDPDYDKIRVRLLNLAQEAKIIERKHLVVEEEKVMTIPDNRP